MTTAEFRSSASAPAGQPWASYHSGPLSSDCTVGAPRSGTALLGQGKVPSSGPTMEKDSISEGVSQLQSDPQAHLMPEEAPGHLLLPSILLGPQHRVGSGVLGSIVLSTPDGVSSCACFTPPLTL